MKRGGEVFEGGEGFSSKVLKHMCWRTRADCKRGTDPLKKKKGTVETVKIDQIIG